MSTPKITSNRDYRRHIKEKKKGEWRVSPELRTGYQETILLSARHDCFARSQLSALLTIVERAELTLKDQIIAKDPMIMYALENAKTISRDLVKDRLCPTEKDIIRDAIDGVGEILAQAQSLVALRAYPAVRDRTVEEMEADCADYRESKTYSTFSSALGTIKKNPGKQLQRSDFITPDSVSSSHLAPTLTGPHVPVTEDSIIMGSCASDDSSDSDDDCSYSMKYTTDEDFQAFLNRTRASQACMEGAFERTFLTPLRPRPPFNPSAIVDLSKTIGKD